MTTLGVTRSALGVTPHGLRHEYAGDRYKAVAGVAAPVRGGMVPDPATDERARLQVAEELGHARLQIASAYLGSRRVAAVPPAAATPEDPGGPSAIGGHAPRTTSPQPDRR
jgi:integrase